MSEDTMKVEYRYEVERIRCRKLLKEITSELKKPIPPDRNWGHVGDMTEVWTELRAIRDFLSTEEE